MSILEAFIHDPLVEWNDRGDESSHHTNKVRCLQLMFLTLLILYSAMRLKVMPRMLSLAEERTKHSILSRPSCKGFTRHRHRLVSHFPSRVQCRS